MYNTNSTLPILGPLNYNNQIQDFLFWNHYDQVMKVRDSMWHFMKYCLKMPRPRGGAYDSKGGMPMYNFKRPSFLMRLWYRLLQLFK